MHRLEPRPDLAGIVEDERNTGHHDPFQPAFQDGRQRAPPCGVDEHERVCTQNERAVIGRHRIDGWMVAVIGDAVGCAHGCTETERVEIEHLYLMARAAQTNARPVGDCVAEAVRVGMGEHHHDLHASATISAA